MNLGKFIVIEGIEGAGKSSAISVVQQVLSEKGIGFINTREPGGTPLAEQLRELVKSTTLTETITPECELLLMYASRSQLVANVIKPSLEQGVWVIGDRHDLSSRAYQGGGRQIAEQEIEQIANITLKGFEPDLTLYLDIDAKSGLTRAKQRGDLDRIELEQLSFFERVRSKYQALAANNNKIVTIDASNDMNVVHQTIRQIVQNFVNKGI